MLAQELQDFRAFLRQKGILFAYSGYVSEPVLLGVGEALKHKLAVADADTKTVRSVFAIFVEQMQNIIRYSAEQDVDEPDADDGLRYGVLTVGHVEEDYVVRAGNLIRHKDAERLRDRLAVIRGMDKSELKSAYKEQLKAGPDADSKGAGVGFIEIARRATKPLEFDFLEVDGEYSFFALKASIGTGELPE